MAGISGALKLRSRLGCLVTGRRWKPNCPLSPPLSLSCSGIAYSDLPCGSVKSFLTSGVDIWWNIIPSSGEGTSSYSTPGNLRFFPAACRQSMWMQQHQEQHLVQKDDWSFSYPDMVILLGEEPIQLLCVLGEEPACIQSVYMSTYAASAFQRDGFTNIINLHNSCKSPHYTLFRNNIIISIDSHAPIRVFSIKVLWECNGSSF